MNNIIKAGFKAGFEKEALFSPAALIGLGITGGLGAGYGALSNYLKDRSPWKGAIRGGLKGVTIPAGAYIGKTLVYPNQTAHSINRATGFIPAAGAAGLGGLAGNFLADLLLGRQQ